MALRLSHGPVVMAPLPVILHTLDMVMTVDGKTIKIGEGTITIRPA